MKLFRVLVVLIGGFLVTGFFGLVFFSEPLFGALGTGGVRGRSPIAEAHEWAITSFAAQQGFGPARLRKKHFWNDGTLLIDGKEYFVDSIHLVAAVGTNAPRPIAKSRCV